MTVRSEWRHGQLVYWDTHRHRVVDAVGDAVSKFEFGPGAPTDDTTGEPTQFTVTEVGTNTNVNASVAGTTGAALLMTTGATEDNGSNLQLKGENFALNAANDLYIGATFTINDVDETDLFFGFAVTDTDLLGAVADAIYFESLDGSAALACVTEKDSTETTTSAVGTLVDATAIRLEIYCAGLTVYFYVDGVLVATHTANVCDDEELTPSIHFLTGEAAANTALVTKFRAFQIGAAAAA
jgi:hypothetical protein